MRGSFFRSLLAFALALSMLVPGLLDDPARAQEAPEVSIRLVSQTIWNSADRPLSLRVQATNESATPLHGLAVVLTIEARARARSIYQLSLHEDATAVISRTSFPQKGEIAPGRSRTFSVRKPLRGLAASDNGVYPLQVQVLSQELVMATLRTPMIFLIENPETPLRLTWTWVLEEPLQLGPDGVFEPGPVEPDIAPGGRIDAMVEAIDASAPAPVDLVVSPVLAEELDRMSHGYRVRDVAGTVRTVPRGTGGAADAARVLGTLRRIASRQATELVALPFGDARLPALLASGMGGDLPVLLDQGRRLVARVLGRSPTERVFWPPLSEVDANLAQQLHELGASTLLLDHDRIPVQPGLNPNPPPVYQLSGEQGLIEAIVPDGEVASVTDPFTDDAALSARVALGEIAAVWLEFPGTPGRGIAVQFDGSPSYPPRFYRNFVAAVRGSPWLRPVRASTLTSLVRDTGRATLSPMAYPPLPAALVDRLLDVRRSVDLFAESAPGASAVVRGFRSDLLMAEGGASVIRPDQGFRFADWVQEQIQATYDRVTPLEAGHIFTLASGRGSIPLKIRNGNRFGMRVAMRFVADPRVAFPKGDVQTLTLPARGVVQLLVSVRPRTTGRFPMKLQVFPPGSTCGTCLIAESDIIVRSTAYNRVALVVTIGAALFLLGWWGRRFLPRRKA